MTLPTVVALTNVNALILEPPVLYEATGCAGVMMLPDVLVPYGVVAPAVVIIKAPGATIVYVAGI